jgi:HSP20 family protein
MSLFQKKHAAQEETAPDWFQETQEGQLAVDVFRQGRYLIIRSTIAGVDPSNLDVAINGDLLTVRGTRESGHEIKEDEWFHRECYWGAFSRSIILPMDVESDKAEASFVHGLLEIRIPLRDTAHNIKISKIEG